ncbi:MAG: glycosyltransferase family 1 protein [Candidatus Bathyarchaeia archaeon]
MRIAIDTTAMPVQRVGAGNYIFNLTCKVVENIGRNECVIFTNIRAMRDFTSLRSRATFVSLTGNSRLQRILWEQFRLPALVRWNQIDLLHSPHYTAPLALDCKLVVTFHDMTFFIYPQMHKTYKNIFFRTMMQLSSRRADMIIAVSESTRQDILRILKLAPSRVTVVPLGVSPNYRPILQTQMIDIIRNKYRLPQRIILYVGVLEPRKNLSTLVRAFKRLVNCGLPHSLVIVGQKGWMYEELFRSVARLELQERVIFTGYVPEEELPMFYNAADVFVYPSVYEGFGLPVLEAMACGIPVVTSNVSSMPEIVGDTGILVNPFDEQALANAIERVVTDPVLSSELKHKSLVRASRFTWEQTALNTIAVYERVIKAQ